MANDKKKLKRMTFLTSFITLASFLYKLGLGIYGLSLVLIIASISTLMVFICKLVFVRNVYNTRERKRKAYLHMWIATLIYTLIFILFIVLKVNDIDISSQKEYTGVIGGLLIGFMVLMFILSIIKLRGALEKTDIMVIGLKEITFISALTDLIIIESYAYGIYLTYQEATPLIESFNRFFPLGVSLVMIVTIIIMFIRYKRYQTTK